MIAWTLRGQVRRYAMWILGWSRESAEDAADIAVEVAGSNWPVLPSTLASIIREACRAEE